MIKAPISLQDLRRSLYVKAKAEPLWRFWGIVLGVLTTGFVFLLLWPEYAADKVIESLEKLMRTTIAFGEEVAERQITAERIAVVEVGAAQHPPRRVVGEDLVDLGERRLAAPGEGAAPDDQQREGRGGDEDQKSVLRQKRRWRQMLLL